MGFQFQTKQSGHVSPYSAPFIRSKDPGQQHGKQVPGNWSMGAEGQLSRDLKKWSSTEGWFCCLLCIPIWMQEKLATQKHPWTSTKRYGKACCPLSKMNSDGLAGETALQDRLLTTPPSPAPTQHRGKIMDLAPLALHSGQHWGRESGPDYCPGLPVTRRLWRLCVWQGPGHHLSNKAASRQWQNWATRFKQEAESQSKWSIKNDEELGKSQSEWEKTTDTNNEMGETRSNKDFKATDTQILQRAIMNML